MARVTTIAEMKRLVFRDVDRRSTPIIHKSIRKQFEIAKRKFLREVELHPISQELLGRDQPSAFLSGYNGSLFGLLGFPYRAQPVSKLINYLEVVVDLELGRIRRGTARVNVRIPSKADFDNDASFIITRWMSRSWVTAVEDGISGLPQFLAKIGKGESKRGIQLKRVVLGKGAYSPPAGGYLTGLIADFREDLKRRFPDLT